VTTLLAIIVGALYAGAIYMMTRRSLVKLVVVSRSTISLDTDLRYKE